MLKFKKIISIGAAIVMSVSMMAVSGSAYKATDDWLLNYANAPGMPSSSYHTSITKTYQPLRDTEKFTVFNENCSYFYSKESYRGIRAKVRYWTFVTDKEGTPISTGFASCYHEVKNSTYKNHYLVTAVDFDRRLVVKYELENRDSVSCKMSGTYRIN